MSIERAPKVSPLLDRKKLSGKQITSQHSPQAPELIASLWAGEISADHPIFANHFAYEKALLPGLAYIDLLLEHAGILGVHFGAAEIRDLSIYRPMVVDSGSRLHLALTAVAAGADAWTVNIDGTTRIAGKDPTETTYARATLIRTARTVFEENADIPRQLREAGRTLSMDQAYQRWRELGLLHSGFMKAGGAIHISASETWIELVASGASDPASGCIVQPVLVDGSIVGAVELIANLADEERRLFLPIHFASFRTSDRLHGTCFARIRTDAVRRKGELISVDIDYFDRDGRKVAELIGFNNKLVRAPSFISSDVAEKPTPQRATPVSAPASIAALVSGIFADQLGIPPSALDLSGSYYDLGLTSAMMLEIVRLIGEGLGVTLSPTLLFEYTAAQALIEHLASVHRPAEMVDRSTSSPAASRPRGVAPISRLAARGTIERIAVIGMSGRYPGSNTIAELWENLKAGRDCITEVPPSRWDWRELERVESPSGKSMSRWGGFIDDVARFDPMFFKISPKEAAAIDPQERLFLEICWEALEDAGYTPQNVVSGSGRNHRRKVGVFAGVMHKDYAFLASEALWGGAQTALSLNYAPIANRVSYACDFHGPSIAVDTVCSASLTAIHMALQSLKCGECEVAIAGGVNLSLHPNKYITYGSLDMHSTDGRCRSFGDGGDGYVSAEGVGAVILKPLDRAEADGDHIYGVLLASAINHVGKASGMTVPSPVAQGDMILECWEQAGVGARSVSYIEAHGTGTSLGDPIEVQGLSRAFAAHTGDTGFCALGSVKSNIGHAESAAGISGLTKTLLQLQYRTLVPTLHSKATNSHLRLADTPFYLPQSNMPWTSDGTTPRRAGVSSFGATGSNAHVLVEEYVDTRPVRDLPLDTDPVLIILSANSSEQLGQYVANLCDHLRRASDEGTPIDLASLAYTLQVGRVSCPVRLAVKSNGIADALAKLQRFAQRPLNSKDTWSGDINQVGPGVSSLLNDDDLLDVTHKWLAKGRIDQLAAAWVQGTTIDWELLHPQGGKRMSLPTYPFEQDHYWVPAAPARSRSGMSIAGAVEQMAGGSNLEASVADLPVQTPHPSVGADAVSELLLFNEVWAPLKLPDDLASVDLGVCICILSDLASVDIWARAIRQVSPKAQLVFAFPSAGRFERVSATNYRFPATEMDWPLALIRAVKHDFRTVDTVLHFGMLRGHATSDDLVAITGLVQAAVTASVPLTRLVVAGVSSDDVSAAHIDSVIAMARSVQTVQPGLRMSVIRVEAQSGAQFLAAGRLADLVLLDVAADDVAAILHRGGERLAPKVEVLPAPQSGAQAPIRYRGTYLITGGAGGVGLITAKYLASTYRANCVLVGRSAPSEDLLRRVREAEAHGGRALYVQADVGDPLQMSVAIAEAEAAFGAIDGVLHAAGTVTADTILEKSPADVRAVLRAKVDGTLVLDELFASRDLDFICLFSSSAAVLGDFGACDYGLANRFQLSLGQNRRTGSASPWVVVAWPLWQDGGMKLGAEATRRYVEASGQCLLESSLAMQLLEQALGGTLPAPLVQIGDRARISEVLNQKVIGRRIQEHRAAASPFPTRVASSSARALIESLKQITHDLLAIPTSRLNDGTGLTDLGFDSITFTKFAKAISERHGIDVAPSIFYAHSTFHELAEHLGAQVQATTVEPSMARAPAPQSDSLAGKDPMPSMAVPPEPRTTDVPTPTEGRPAAIAIVGMSGQFPGAVNIEELWDLLARGQSAVEELSPDRLTLEVVEQPQENVPPTRWLARIDRFAEFDAPFFEISPREAEAIDPRQRLLLQESWRALEDAALCGEALATSRIGVFVGAEQGDYQQLRGEATLTSNHDGILASRLSYFLNLRGPALTINTACSSGLVALHQACLSLRSGECDVAVVSAANLLLSPLSFATLSDAGMLSKSGKCSAFDRKADGIVPGEAVVAVVLRRQADAERDGDPIRAVIVGDGINHDGKTNGITAPNGKAQAMLVAEIHDRFGIDAGSIGHVVTHGTGTRLGDPVEIAALDRAFRTHVSELQCCAITSNKPNIGHGFAASGLSSLVALVQGFTHDAIPPSINCEDPSDYFAWSSSPFYVNRQYRAWPRGGRPRLGAVSAFGMSGTNAHIVVQDFEHERLPHDSRSASHLLPLTAKSREALHELCKQMADALRAGDLAREPLSAVSLTLVTGRRHFAKRLAVVATDHLQAIAALEDFAEGTPNERAIFGEVPLEFTADPLVVAWMERGSTVERGATAVDGADWLLAVARRFVDGYEIPPTVTLRGTARRRLNLPTYPFTTRRYLKRGAVAHPPAGRAPVARTTSAGTDAPSDRMARLRSADVFYSPQWTEEIATTPVVESVASGATLIIALGRGGPLLDALIAEQRDKRAGMSVLRPGDAPSPDYANLSDQAWRRAFVATAPVYGQVFIVGEEAGDEGANETLGLLVDALPALLDGLQQRGRLAAPADVYVVAFDCHSGSGVAVRPSGLAAMGHWLAQTGHPYRVRNLDVLSADPADTLGVRRTLGTIMRSVPSARGGLVRVQGGSRATMRFHRLQHEAAELPSALRQGGTYVIVGGAGIVGRAVTAHLVGRYGARVAWIGRRPAAQLDPLTAPFGDHVSYFEADATNGDELSRVIGRIRQTLGKIDGAVFSAAQIEGAGAIASGSSSQLQSGRVKRDGARNLYNAVRADSLDFLCYFSSIQSYDFISATDTLGYAAGSHIVDAFARAIAGAPFPVGVINWGYWAASILDTEWERRLRDRFGLLTDAEGCEAFDMFVRMLGNGGPRQAIVMKGGAATDHVLSGTQDVHWTRRRRASVLEALKEFTLQS